MKNAVLITTSDQKLKSVNQIQKNIFSAYGNISNTKIKKINIDILSENRKFSPFDIVVIVDLASLTSDNFKNIFSKNFSNDNTLYVFHLMGDFFRKKEFFVKIENLLIKRKVLFIAPSASHRHLVSKCIKNFKTPIIPFPIDFFKIKTSRKSELEKHRKNFLKLKNNEHAFIYAGRISTQKNVLELIKIFHKQASPNSKLIIAGDIDNLESPTFFESLPLPGNLFLEITQYIKSNHLENRILLLGPLKNKVLHKTIQASDQFVSLSMYHDEDFGFFPIEAIYLGLPGTLTNWGGFRDLNFNSKTITKINIKLSKNFLESQNIKLEEKKPLSQKAKLINQRMVVRTYSIASFSKSVEKLLKNSQNNRFKGFTLKFKEITTNALFNHNANLKDYKFFYSGFWK